MKNVEKGIVINDIHIPFQDKKAVYVTLKFIEDFQPDCIFLNGDIMDCWDISKFTKPLHIQTRMTEEILETEYFLNRLRQICPKSKIIYIFGNHEYRFECYIANNAKELYGLKGLSLEEQLDLKGKKIEVVNSHQKENFYRYGKLLIGHFDKCNKHAGFTAKNLLEDKGVSLIQSHTHRMGSSFKRDFDSLKGAWENGCLCDLNPNYTMLPNWQHCISVILTNKKNNNFQVIQIPIINGELTFGDKVFK